MTFSRKLSRTRTTRCSASRKTDCNKHNPYIKSTEKRDAAIADERFILNASSAIAASSFYCFILPALYLLPASLPPGARRCHALDRACTVPLYVPIKSILLYGLWIFVRDLSIKKCLGVRSEGDSKFLQLPLPLPAEFPRTGPSLLQPHVHNNHGMHNRPCPG